MIRTCLFPCTTCQLKSPVLGGEGEGTRKALEYDSGMLPDFQILYRILIAIPPDSATERPPQNGVGTLRSQLSNHGHALSF